jgi:hypothetical protein
MAYRILLSDDNTALFSTLKEIAYGEDVELNCCSNWEDAKVKLMDDLEQNQIFKNFDAIILDGKGKLHDASKDSNPHHLTESVNWLAQQNALGNYLPIVVFTGFHETISEFQPTNSQVLKIFSKGAQVNSSFKDVLSYLKKVIDESPVNKFKSAFPDAYSFTQKHFSSDNKKLIRELFALLMERKGTFIWKKNSLDALRRLNEALVDTIPSNYYSTPFNTREYIEKIKRDSTIGANAGNRSVKFMDFFHDNDLAVPDPIYDTIKNIYYTASTYASHNDEAQSNYYPSTEMILGLVYSHFGCYHWFNSIIKD